MGQSLEITEENFEEIKKDASENGLRLISIIEEYERVLGLSIKENPILKPNEKMYDKVDIATKMFIDKFQNSDNSELLTSLVNNFSLLALRLGNLILDLIGKQEVILVPSKRNYLYMGKPALTNLFNNLVEHKKIADPILAKDALTELSNVSKITDGNSQTVLEFRIINILIMFLTIFIDDRQTISFLSYLMKTQEEISMGGK